MELTELLETGCESVLDAAGNSLAKQLLIGLNSKKDNTRETHNRLPHFIM